MPINARQDFRWEVRGKWKLENLHFRNVPHFSTTKNRFSRSNEVVDEIQAHRRNQQTKCYPMMWCIALRVLHGCPADTLAGAGGTSLPAELVENDFFWFLTFIQASSRHRIRIWLDFRILGKYSYRCSLIKSKLKVRFERLSFAVRFCDFHDRFVFAI